MDLPRLELLVRAAAAALPPCVSLHLPTHVTGRETRQGPIRLKAQLQEARQQAAAAGNAGHVLDDLLAPVAALIDDHDFWQHQGHGLSLLVAPGLRHVLRLPFTIEPWTVVAERLHLRPLLPLTDDLAYRVLALSRGSVRAYRGDRWALHDEELEGLPVDAAAAATDADEPSLQHHGFALPHGDRTVYHGHGGAGAETRDADDLARLLRLVDEALDRAPDPRLPIVLAGVTEVAAAFRTRSRHAARIAAVATGNADTATAAALHAVAWPLLQPRLEQRHHRALARYHEVAGTGRTSDDVVAVVGAARRGRIADLFVARQRACWGRVAPDQSPQRHAERRPGDVDLLDVAVVETLLRGGAVHEVENGPAARDGVAATFRY